MVQVMEEQDLEKLILASNATNESDDESEDESYGLNISCHGSQFRQMVQENKCDSNTVRKRKLQTHLDSLGSELSTLCFSLKENFTDSVKSKDSDLKETELSPRTAKIIKRSLENSPPKSTTR